MQLSTLRAINRVTSPFGLTVLPNNMLNNSGLPAAARLFGFSITYPNWQYRDFTDNYLKTAGLYSVVNRIAKMAAMAKMKVYRIREERKNDKNLQTKIERIKAWTGEGATPTSLVRAHVLKNQVFVEDSSHRMNKLIDRPNPYQGYQQFTQNGVGFRLLNGEKFWYKKKLGEKGVNAGKTKYLFNLPPQYMGVFGDGTLWGISGYQITLRQIVDIPVTDVIFSKYWNPEFDLQGTQLRGCSPVRSLQGNIDRIQMAEGRSITSLKNAGAAGMIVDESPKPMNQQQSSAFKEKINDEALGIENNGRIVVANGKLSYLKFGVNESDLKGIELENLSQRNICNVYHVPYILHDPDNSSYNNLKEAKKEMITMAVIPELSLERDDWNEIAKEYGDDLWIDYDISVFPELQEDLEKLTRIAKESWWWTGNEKRIAQMMDEDEDEPMMKAYLVPTGLQDIRNLGELPEDDEDDADKPKPKE